MVTFAPDQKLACGAVNAKNGFGGYTGETMFAYDDGVVFHFDGAKSAPFQRVFERCLKAAKSHTSETTLNSTGH